MLFVEHQVGGLSLSRSQSCVFFFFPRSSFLFLFNPNIPQPSESIRRKKSTDRRRATWCYFNLNLPALEFAGSRDPVGNMCGRTTWEKNAPQNGNDRFNLPIWVAVKVSLTTSLLDRLSYSVGKYSVYHQNARPIKVWSRRINNNIYYLQKKNSWIHYLPSQNWQEEKKETVKRSPD